jgi:hypothetical protein
MNKQKFDFCMRMIDYHEKRHEHMMVQMYAAIISKHMGLPILGSSGELKILDKLGMRPNAKNFGMN